MTMTPPQSHRSPGSPSGLRTNVVRLCVALLGTWVVASVLFMPLSTSVLATDIGGVAGVSSQVHAAGLEMQDQQSSDCCPDVGCSDSPDCSMPCTSSCFAPSVAMLDRLSYRERSSGADLVSTLADDGFVQPTVTAPFRPPIV